jgi:hypothetical protein
MFPNHVSNAGADADAEAKLRKEFYEKAEAQARAKGYGSYEEFVAAEDAKRKELAERWPEPDWREQK